MKQTEQLINELRQGIYDELLEDIYIDKSRIPYEKERYEDAVRKYEELFGKDIVEIYSAPGRSEIGGNHTDHQHGEVLAASINNDAIAVSRAREDGLVKVVSGTDPMITIDISDLEKKNEEEGTTPALIRGVLAGLKDKGYSIGGFQAYITSNVLIGAGLSSSAAFETVVGTIISGIYNNMQISAVEIAIVGQYAENVYFGKPCGLMDQMACSVGSLVYIDFADPEDPTVEKVELDLDSYGYSLCITDTKGSHADLTDDYAAIPAEMKKAAEVFGKEYLSEVDPEEFMAGIQKVREAAGDRAALRAIHFMEDNARVRKETAALKAGDVQEFLQNIALSGNSSFKYLQNVYTNRDVEHQNVSLALAVSESVLDTDGVCRVHGGGFAGTIQAFVKNEAVDRYKAALDSVFGQDSCCVLKIRKYGGMKVI